MSKSLCIMIGLFQNMFGDLFWENVVLETTHWSFASDNERVRNDKNPPVTETTWAIQLNDALKEDFRLTRSLPAVFIDTYYNQRDEHQTKKFQEHTQKLWNLTQTYTPFECKDIKIALTEIRELQNSVKHLEKTKQDQDNEINNLKKYKKSLEKEITDNGLNLPPPPGTADALQDDNSNYYSPTEFALFGVGICMFGILIGLVLFSLCRNDKSTEVQQHYSYSLAKDQGIRRESVEDHAANADGVCDAKESDHDSGDGGDVPATEIAITDIERGGNKRPDSSDEIVFAC
jgi:hypothetical protein